jgi:hypothetical protein
MTQWRKRRSFCTESTEHIEGTFSKTPAQRHIFGFPKKLAKTIRISGTVPDNPAHFKMNRTVDCWLLHYSRFAAKH